VPPEIRYARNGTVTVAWAATGTGSIDLLFLPGLISHIETFFEEPALARFLEEGLGRFCRVIVMDRRGTGMSDPMQGTLRIEDELADLDAVLDAAGSERAAVLGYTSGGPLAALYAAQRPERIRALVLYAAIARFVAAPGYDWTHDEQQRAETFAEMIRNWGTGANLDRLAPSAAGDDRLRAWLARLERRSSSPGQMQALNDNAASVDVREALPTIRVPTLVLHRRGDQLIDVRHGRFLGQEVPGARYVELEGDDNLPIAGDTEALLGEIEEFLTGGRRSEPRRTLLTVRRGRRGPGLGHGLRHRGGRRLPLRGPRPARAARHPRPVAAVRPQLRVCPRARATR
jgi:pimeloyl-ACP methyl ester carboxylesterase